MVLPKDILNIIYKKQSQLHYQDVIDEYKKKINQCLFCGKFIINNPCNICSRFYCNRCYCLCNFIKKDVESNLNWLNKIMNYEIIILYFIFKSKLFSSTSVSIYKSLFLMLGIRTLSNKIILSNGFSRLYVTNNNSISRICLLGFGYLTSIEVVGNTYFMIKNLVIYNQLPFF